mgnify:CR=1 FL=1
MMLEGFHDERPKQAGRSSRTLGVNLVPPEPCLAPGEETVVAGSDASLVDESDVDDRYVGATSSEEGDYDEDGEDPAQVAAEGNPVYRVAAEEAEGGNAQDNAEDEAERGNPACGARAKPESIASSGLTPPRGCS